MVGQEVLQRRWEPWSWRRRWPAIRRWYQPIERTIKAYPLTTTQEVAEELIVDHSVVIWHLKQIGKIKKLSQWVPHELIANQKNHCLEMSSSLILCNNKKPFLDQIVTCGSVWRKMETYITIYKIYSQWEFAVWLKELKPGLGNNLVKGCRYEWMTLGLLASGRKEFISGPVTRLHWSELLCNKVLLKRDRESFWLTSEGDRKSPPLLVFSKELYTYCC